MGAEMGIAYRIPSEPSHACQPSSWPPPQPCARAVQAGQWITPCSMAESNVPSKGRGLQTSALTAVTPHAAGVGRHGRDVSGSMSSLWTRRIRAHRGLPRHAQIIGAYRQVDEAERQGEAGRVDTSHGMPPAALGPSCGRGWSAQTFHPDVPGSQVSRSRMPPPGRLHPFGPGTRSASLGLTTRCGSSNARGEKQCPKRHARPAGPRSPTRSSTSAQS